MSDLTKPQQENDENRQPVHDGKDTAKPPQADGPKSLKDEQKPPKTECPNRSGGKKDGEKIGEKGEEIGNKKDKKREDKKGDKKSVIESSE